MEKSRDYKEVEIKDRKFIIKKFDAKTGSFMLIRVTSILAPMFKNSDLKKITVEDGNTPDISSVDIIGMMSGLSGLSEQDFNYIQDKCLNVCYELLAAGPTRVLNQDGTFGVIGLENDTMTVMALTAHALIFNVTSFFGGSPLASLVGEALNLIQPTVQM